jgi:hypothetical protein
MALFRFEHRGEPLASPAVFAGRLARNMLASWVLIGAVLALGMAGYHLIENMRWLDAFLNASMLLGGMGPVDAMKSDVGKLFAGLYALLCGLVVVAATGLFLAPVLHRVMHAVHAEDDGN